MRSEGAGVPGFAEEGRPYRRHSGSRHTAAADGRGGQPGEGKIITQNSTPELPNLSEGGSNTINPQLINSQSELSKDYFDTLQSNGTLTSGGRSGGTTPQTAPASSYYITDGGHVVIYGQDGIKVMDTWLTGAVP